MSTTPRLPEHPPHEPHVPCLDVVKALQPPLLVEGVTKCADCGLVFGSRGGQEPSIEARPALGNAILCSDCASKRPAKTPTAVDLPVPVRRIGPLRKGCMLALRQNRQLDAAGQQRSEQALAEARAIVAEEARAKAVRQADLLQAAVEDHGPIEIPEGYGLRDVVEKDGTYLELVEVAKRPAQPARRGS